MRTITLTFSFALLSLVISCKKEDNVSYTSFWYKESVSNNLINLQGSSTITVYINEVNKGSFPASEWKSGPDCNGSNFTVVNNLGEETSATYNYVIRDQTGDDKFSGTYTANKDECLSIELDF